MPVVYSRIMIQLVMLASFSFLLPLSHAMASCNWVGNTSCAADNNPHGAYCSSGICYCGDFFNVSETSKTERCSIDYAIVCPCGRGGNPSCPPICSCPYIYTDTVYKLVNSSTGQPCKCKDGDVRGCTTDGGCSGNQTCINGQWEECKSQDPCCGSPDQCCQQNQGGNGKGIGNQSGGY